MTNVSKSWTTHGTKELQAIIEPGTAHYILQWNSGGELPQELTGRFTSLFMLDIFIQNYLNSNIPKEQINTADKAKAKYEAKQAKIIED